MTIFAKEAEISSEETKTDLKTEIDEYIQHHLKDSHDFSLFSYSDSEGAEHHVGFPLPVILWDNGLVVFSSSRFHH
ncbi:MAG: ATP synthase F0 subunit A, partial [Eudoraea sp.]